MSLPIHVTAYSGYKSNERPREFTVDKDLYEIAEVEDRWYEPDAMYFRVRTTEGKRFILRYTESEDEWTLQSGFDGDELLARPSIQLITVDADVIRRAEKGSHVMRALSSRRRRDSVRWATCGGDWQPRSRRVHSHHHGTLSELQTSAD